MSVLIAVLIALCGLAFRAVYGTVTIASSVDHLATANSGLGATMAKMVALIGEMRNEHDKAHDSILSQLRTLASSVGKVSNDVAVLVDRKE